MDAIKCIVIISIFNTKAIIKCQRYTRKDIPALEVDIKLGQLYDGRTDTFVNEFMVTEDIPEDAITTLNNPNQIPIQYTLENNYEKMFNMIIPQNIYANNMKLSLLSGLIKPKGASQFLDYVTDNSLRMRTSIFFYYTLKDRNLNIIHRDLSNIINKDVLSRTNATYVLIGITYGIRAALVIENNKVFPINPSEREKELNSVTTIIMKQAKGKILSAQDLNLVHKYLNESESGFNVTLFTDTESPRSISLFDSLYILTNYKEFSKTINNGKGAPVGLRLLSLEVSTKRYQINWVNSGKLIDVSLFDFAVEQLKWNEFLQDINKYELHINGIDYMANRRKDYLDQNQLNQLETIKQSLNHNKTTIKNNLAQALVKIRFGEDITQYLDILLKDSKKVLENLNPKNYLIDTLMEKKFGRIINEVQLIDELLANNITVLKPSQNFEQFLRENKQNMILLLVYNTDWKDYSTLDVFKMIISFTYNHDHNTTLFCAVNSNNINQNNSNSKISMYINGVLTIDNYDVVYKSQQMIESLTKPVGFIYVQIDEQQSPPNTLWPENEWKDISDQYAGLFFRAVGGRAAALGETQEQSFPMLSEVQTTLQKWIDFKVKPRMALPFGKWSEYIRTGGFDSFHPRTGIAFLRSDKEVRPRSQSVRIWKCSRKQSYELWTSSRLNRLARDSVPQVYAQLSAQSEPSSLWPSFQWSDISRKYSDLFFRVEDKGRTQLGEVKGQSGPTLLAVKSKLDLYRGKDDQRVWSLQGTGQLSEWIRLGKTGNDREGLKFKVSSQEIRPENQAFKVWMKGEAKEETDQEFDFASSDNFKKQLDHLIDKYVPKGLIYVELGSESDPKQLWPSLQWQDISHQYAGLFFRALGNQSNPMGVTQSQSCPALTEVEFGDHFNVSESPVTEISIGDKSWTPFLISGSYGGVWSVIRFHLSNDEVRPRNQAIRIWIRV